MTKEQILRDAENLVRRQQHRDSIRILASYLENKDKNLLQIVLTQMAGLSEIEEDLSMKKINDTEADREKARIRGALNYVIKKIKDTDELK